MYIYDAHLNINMHAPATLSHPLTGHADSNIYARTSTSVNVLNFFQVNTQTMQTAVLYIIEILNDFNAVLYCTGILLVYLI